MIKDKQEVYRDAVVIFLRVLVLAADIFSLIGLCGFALHSVVAPKNSLPRAVPPFPPTDPLPK